MEAYAIILDKGINTYYYAGWKKKGDGSLLPLWVSELNASDGQEPQFFFGKAGAESVADIFGGKVFCFSGTLVDGKFKPESIKG